MKDASTQPGRTPDLRNLELLMRTGLLHTQGHDLESVVQAATDAGLQLSGAQFGAFFYNVINAQGENDLLYAFSGMSREKFAAFPMPRDTADFGHAFGGQATVRSGDITNDPRYGKGAPLFGMPRGSFPSAAIVRRSRQEPIR